MIKTTQITMTQDDIKKVMEEFKRRIKLDLEDKTISHNARYLREEIACRMQGVYGTIMAVVPNRNWQDIVWWLDDELDELYAYFGLEKEQPY